MLKQVKIKGYKSFKDMDLTLTPLAILIGPNAAGKSNFLDALYLISHLVTSPNLKEAFQGHRGLPLESTWYGDDGFERLLERRSVTTSLEVIVELSEATVQDTEQVIRQKRHGLDAERNERKWVIERLLRYTVKVELMPRTGVLRVVGEDLRALRPADMAPTERRRPFLEKVGERLRLRMEGQGRPTEFPIGLDHTVVSTPLYEPHYPHVSAFRAELGKWRTYYLEPRKLMREDVPVSDSQSIGPRGENFAAFLNSLKHNNRAAFDNLRLTVKSILPAEPEIDVTLSKEGTVGIQVAESGLVFSGRLISEGTLRVMGLIAAIHPDNPATLIGYEEPENGVHPVRIKQIADILKNAAEQYGKQIIVTTHSPAFATRFSTDALYVCRKDETQSSIEPIGLGGPLLDGKDIEKALADALVRGDFGG